VYRVLYGWRHRTAKLHNKCRTYVLNSTLLVEIARTLPKDIPAICRVSKKFSPLMRNDLETVKQLILIAVKDIPETTESLRKVSYLQDEDGSWVISPNTSPETITPLTGEKDI